MFADIGKCRGECALSAWPTAFPGWGVQNQVQKTVEQFLQKKAAFGCGERGLLWKRLHEKAADFQDPIRFWGIKTFGTLKQMGGVGKQSAAVKIQIMIAPALFPGEDFITVFCPAVYQAAGIRRERYGFALLVQNPLSRGGI